eukprot:GEMP01098975.1.p1 GENE.GEMP01098975.1~~GEMP01098975.1.p1  ORF type:complete len:106 (+),score=11.50 GEMP01098975.1:45-320(+)
MYPPVHIYSVHTHRCAYIYMHLHAGERRVCTHYGRDAIDRDAAPQCRESQGHNAGGTHDTRAQNRCTQGRGMSALRGYKGLPTTDAERLYS